MIEDIVPANAPFDGRWWIPLNPDDVVGGRLSLIDGVWELTINGWLGTWNPGIRDNPTPLVIHGAIGTMPVTVLDVVFGGQTGGLTGAPFETRFHANVVLTGVCGDSNLRFTHARMRFHNLNEWANRRTWSTTFGSQENPFEASISYNNPGEERALIPGASVILSRSLQIQDGLAGASLNSDEWLTFEFDDPQGLRAIEWDFVRPMRHFLELAVNEQCPLIGIELNPEHLEHPFQKVSVLTALHRGDLADRGNWFHFNFNLTDIIFGDVLRDWWVLHSMLGSTVDLLASLRMRSFVGSNFLTAATSIESYHRNLNNSIETTGHLQRLNRIELALTRKDFRWLKRFIRHSYEPDFSQRIDSVVSEAGEFFEAAIGNKSKWRDWIVKARNGSAHRGPGMMNVDQEWIVTVRIAASIQFLMSIVIMKRLAISREIYEDRISRTAELRFLTDELRSLVPDWFEK